MSLPTPIVVSAATLRPTPCLRCDHPIQVGDPVKLTAIRHPSFGEMTGLRHARCPRGWRLTDRGRMVRDLAVCALAACSVVAISAVIVVNWPALQTLMGQP